MGLLGKIEKALKSLRDPIFRRALRFGVAPSHEHRAMLKGLGDIRTVVDVGANVGQFALISHSALPHAQIHSFEPLSQARQLFEKALEGMTRVRLHPVALGKERATLQMHVTARSDSSSLLVPALQSKIYSGTHEVRTEAVEVVPLEDRLSRVEIIAPAMLKIDVQGYELEVLQGCQTLLDAFEFIFAELSFVELYAGQTLAPQVIGWLADQGFELHGCFVSPLSYKDGQMIQGDFLFRRTTSGKGQHK